MKILNAIISLLIMITIAPLIAIITLAFLNPAEFGGEPNIQKVMTMYLFAIITVPLWVTYIPAIILTLTIMHRIDKKETFHELSIVKIIFLSVPIGAIGGVLILAPVLFLVAEDSKPLLLSWTLAGAVSGIITLTLISLIYRVSRRIAPKKTAA
jgi:hypothetical protein